MIWPPEGLGGVERQKTLKTPKKVAGPDIGFMWGNQLGL